jgi:hypothetical protein
MFDAFIEHLSKKYRRYIEDVVDKVISVLYLSYTVSYEYLFLKVLFICIPYNSLYVKFPFYLSDSPIKPVSLFFFKIFLSIHFSYFRLCFNVFLTIC